MKLYRNSLLTSVLAMLLVTLPIGCTESVMDNINKNESTPPVSAVDGRFQLTDAIMSMAFTTYGGAYAWHVASYTEQIFGDGGTQMMFAELRDPIVTAAPTTFNNEWNNTYHNLLNIAQIIEKCDNGINKGQKDLRGMARVLKVLGFQALTELHGDIPYSEALNAAIRNPKLDKQGEIYKDLLVEIDSAIDDLEDALEKGSSVVGSQDILYKGDVKKWLAFAYGVKSRLLLDGSAKDSHNFSLALEAAEKALANGFNGAELSIFNGVDADNSWYAFFKSRHYSGACGTVAELMIERDDPRLQLYANDTFSTGVIYSPAGDAALANTIDNVGAPKWLSNPTATIHLLSLASLKFIIAECKARLGRDAKDDLHDAIKASFEDYGQSSNTSLASSDIEDYLANLSSSGLEEIVIQKYLSQSRDEQIEAYNDIRRYAAIGENYIVLKNPNNKDSGDLGENRWPLSLPYGNSDVVSNPNVAAAFGTGNGAGYYIFTQNLWLFSK